VVLGMTRRFTLDAATDLAERALRAAGANDEAALSLARATVSANAHGKGSSGFSHLMDYLNALRAGRIVGDAEPIVTSPAPATIHCDAKGGIAQVGFDRAFDSLCERVRTFGLALFAQSGSYTTGELGYYPRRLADVRLVAFAATSGPALMTVPGAKTPVYCTNPIAFAAPLDEGAPLLIDQASSATAFVQLRHYAERSETLPAGWAVDADGAPTTDPKAALRGALLAFGGARGANIALMVEVMAAGLAGANWALDAPSFISGDRSPGAGLLVIAITPALLAPDLPQRLRLQLDRLAKLGVHIPGRRAAATEIELPDALAAEIERAGAP
jgi:(2R)-3-sulfolactate dehydrogenase (NADP+)